MCCSFLQTQKLGLKGEKTLQFSPSCVATLLETSMEVSGMGQDCSKLQCSDSMEVRLEQSQNRKLCFWWILSIREHGPKAMQWEANPALLMGRKCRSRTLWGHPLSFWYLCTLSFADRGVYLGLDAFQRNVNANKIITKLCFKFPWGQYCCCHVWKPNLCQRMSMQQYLLTCPLLRRCRAIRKQMVERKLWSSLRKPFDSTNCCKQCSASLIVIVWGWEGFKLSRLLPVGWFLGMANGHRAIA